MSDSQPRDYLWQDLRIGLGHEFQVSITEEMMLRFRTDTGDVNPLHTDDAYARAHGFDRRVAYGMLVASFYSTLAGVHLPGRRCLLHGAQITFVKPVYVGDHLTVSGEITYLNEAYHQVHVAAQIARSGTGLVSKAKLLAGVLAPG